MEKRKRRSDCPVHFALEVFGDRWTLLVIRDLMFKGKHYYGEFLQSGEQIATNLLADRLASLEDQAIICRSADPAHKQKIRYRLTPKGIDLVPVLVELIMWSAKYDDRSAVEAKFVREVKRDKEGLIEGIRARLKEELRSP